MIHLERPRADEYAAAYGGYVARVPRGDLVRILDRQIRATVTLLKSVPPGQEDHAYAPGKWTIKEVAGHLADVERVMGYRALRIARGDATELAGYDDEAYVAAGCFGGRALADLVGELRTVRRATVSLFAGLPADAWTRRGHANGEPVSVRALACIIAGHELHHRALLRDRYLAAGRRR